MANASNTTPVLLTQNQQAPRQGNPVLQPVDDVPGLPRVLLIGDSISMGYTLPVRQMLKDEANVHRPLTNCGPTIKALSELDDWLGDEKWDVIHFNFGLHDLKYIGPAGQNLADPEAADSHQQVPPDAYRENLKTIVRRLKETGAKLIWRTTTPVPEGAAGRVPGDAAKYNQIAAAIMAEENVPVDDQYTFALERLTEIQRPANVHFTPEGSQLLAEQVVKAIRAALMIDKP
ncbi:MAG: SGNH/GDSL hydrolase family protein [bacterium]|nr:SGNH/GDSL hydrolase family protein [bacterium]